MADKSDRVRRLVRRAVQVVLCAGAIGGGAAAAAVTTPDVRATAPHERAAEVIERDVRRPAPRRASPTTTATPPTAATAEAPAERAVEAPEPRPLAPFGEPLRDGRVITGATPHRMLLLTFDDGPDPRHTRRLLGHLDRHGVKAVFFLTASRLAGNGRWQRQNQEIAREIAARGHIIANHTLDHAQLPLLSDAEVIRQVEEADAIFERVLGARTWLVRPPGGAHTERVDAIFAAHGSTPVMWNLGSGDFQVRDPEEVLRVFRRVLQVRARDYGQRGGVVLLHDIHEWSVDAVPLILDWLARRNCQLLAQGEELYEILDDPRLFYVPRGDASPSAEAAPLTLSPEELEARQAPLREATRARCES